MGQRNISGGEGDINSASGQCEAERTGGGVARGGPPSLGVSRNLVYTQRTKPFLNEALFFAKSFLVVVALVDGFDMVFMHHAFHPPTHPFLSLPLAIPSQPKAQPRANDWRSCSRMTSAPLGGDRWPRRTPTSFSGRGSSSPQRLSSCCQDPPCSRKPYRSECALCSLFLRTRRRSPDGTRGHEYQSIIVVKKSLKIETKRLFK